MMKKRFLILLATAFLAMVLSSRTDSKECSACTISTEIEVSYIDETEFTISENEPEYGIPSQNSYSVPIRNIQPVKRPSSTNTSTSTFAAKAGKSIDIISIFKTLDYCVSDYSGTFAPQRRLISLRKLVI